MREGLGKFGFEQFLLLRRLLPSCTVCYVVFEQTDANTRTASGNPKHATIWCNLQETRGQETGVLGGTSTFGIIGQKSVARTGNFFRDAHLYHNGR